MTPEDVAKGLVEPLTLALAPHGFVPAAGPLPGLAAGAPVVAAWVRKTWNTNRAVILVVDPEQGPIGALARAVRDTTATSLGYWFFLYVLGLQVIVVGRDLDERVADLAQWTDKYDNQWAIVQSIHAVDIATGRRTSARTFAQLVTGKFQDAIQGAIDAGIAPPAEKAAVGDVENPFAPPKT